MLFEALAACHVPRVRKDYHWDSIGYTLENDGFFVGVYYEQPDNLIFSTLRQIDGNAAARLGVGEVAEVKSLPGGRQWIHTANLSSELVFFFTRSKASQMQWLEGFLRECIAAGRAITDDPPTT